MLQFLLIRQGIDVPVNAYFDGPTLHGVRLMQQRLHLRPTASSARTPSPRSSGASPCRSRGRIALATTTGRTTRTAC